MSPAIVGFAALWYFSNAYEYFYAEHALPIKPWYSYAVTAAATLLVARACHFKRIAQGSPRRLLAWAIAYFVVVAISFIWSTQGPVAVQAVISATEMMVLLASLLILFAQREWLRAAMLMVVVATLLGVAINLAEFIGMTTRDLSTVPGRSAGLYRDANMSGTYLAIGMAVSGWVIPRKYLLLLCVFVGMGVVVTFSRSSMLVWGVGVVLLAWYERLGLSRGVGLAIVSGVVLVAATAVLNGKMVGAFEALGFGQHLTDNAASRVTGSFLGQGDDSVRGRLRLAQEALQLFLKAPIGGNGLGATSEWGLESRPHNLFLMMAAEGGLLGLAVLVSGLVILCAPGARLGRTCAMQLSISFMFSHTGLGEAPGIVVLAIAVSHSALGDLRRTKSAARGLNPEMRQ